MEFKQINHFNKSTEYKKVVFLSVFGQVSKEVSEYNMLRWLRKNL